MEKLAEKLGYRWVVVAVLPIAAIIPYETIPVLWWTFSIIQVFGLFMIVMYRKIIFKYDDFDSYLNYNGKYKFKIDDIVRFKEIRNGSYGHQLYEVIKVNPLTIKCLLKDFSHEMVIDVDGIKKVDKAEINYFYNNKDN